MSAPGRPKREYRSVQHEGRRGRDPDLGRTLLAIARSAIGTELGCGQFAEANHDALARPAATFVTLKLVGDAISGFSA